MRGRFDVQMSANIVYHYHLIYYGRTKEKTIVHDVGVINQRQKKGGFYKYILRIYLPPQEKKPSCKANLPGQGLPCRAGKARRPGGQAPHLGKIGEHQLPPFSLT